MRMKAELNAYYRVLVANPTGVRSLADLIAFNAAHPELKKPARFEDQSMCESICSHPLSCSAAHAAA